MRLILRESSSLGGVRGTLRHTQLRDGSAEPKRKTHLWLERSRTPRAYNFFNICSVAGVRAEQIG